MFLVGFPCPLVRFRKQLLKVTIDTITHHHCYCFHVDLFDIWFLLNNTWYYNVSTGPPVQLQIINSLQITHYCQMSIVICYIAHIQ